MSPRRTAVVLPSARRLITSLRDVGYSSTEAVADLVDNSVAAGARRVDVDVRFAGAHAYIRIVDDGSGMGGGQITEAMRYGAERDYHSDDLGKFGLGLKTASMSQCRRLSVASRISPQRAHVEARQLDLDHIEATDRWEILLLAAADRPDRLTAPLRHHTGTVVLWEDLDRILPYKDTSGGWARNRLLALAEQVDVHLGMVFHRFLAGEVEGRPPLTITVNDSEVDAWDPFSRDEQYTEQLRTETYEITAHNGSGLVRVEPFILPPRHRFSDESRWRAASGPNNWNRQQGFYFYRANRLIQSGGWSRLRTQDEHTKLARIGLFFGPELDNVFGINVAKMRVALPPALRDEIGDLVRRTTARAQVVYREKDPAKSAKPAAAPSERGQPAPSPSDAGTAPTSSSTGRGVPDPGRDPDPERDGTDAGTSRPPGEADTVTVREALERAAHDAGAVNELQEIIRALTRHNPEVARGLGW